MRANTSQSQQNLEPDAALQNIILIHGLLISASPDRHHHHLGTQEKCIFSGSIPEPWDLQIVISNFTSSADYSDMIYDSYSIILVFQFQIYTFKILILVSTINCYSSVTPQKETSNFSDGFDFRQTVYKGQILRIMKYNLFSPKSKKNKKEESSSCFNGVSLRLMMRHSRRTIEDYVIFWLQMGWKTIFQDIKTHTSWVAICLNNKHQQVIETMIRR